MAPADFYVEPCRSATKSHPCLSIVIAEAERRHCAGGDFTLGTPKGQLLADRSAHVTYGRSQEPQTSHPPALVAPETRPSHGSRDSRRWMK
jgi:hypothetical protein